MVLFRRGRGRCGSRPDAVARAGHGWEHKYIAVLVPSAPVPFGGALIYVPADWIKPADGGVERLMNVYVSMGVTPPVSKPPVAMPPAPMAPGPRLPAPASHDRRR